MGENDREHVPLEIDGRVLDEEVAKLHGMGSFQKLAATNQILQDLQSYPNSWINILQNLHNLDTKLLTLELLEEVIKNRWNDLPIEQRDGMKNYIYEVIVQLSSDESPFCREVLYVNKLNIILVQILKHEWPTRWKSFIPDLVSAAKTNETICENFMAILKLHTNEVFDFSRGVKTQKMFKKLEESLNRELELNHEICLFVLSKSQRMELIRATLATLHAFLSWIPLVHIFDMLLLEAILKFFPMTSYRNLTLQCLTKFAAHQFRQSGDRYDMCYALMYASFVMQLQTILPPETNIPEA